MSTSICEAKLIDFVLDLHSQYDGADPRPKGSVIQFTIVHENTTYPVALKEIQALFTVYGLRPIQLSVEPGPQVKQKFNRCIKFTISRGSLM